MNGYTYAQSMAYIERTLGLIERGEHPNPARAVHNIAFHAQNMVAIVEGFTQPWEDE